MAVGIFVEHLRRPADGDTDSATLVTKVVPAPVSAPVRPEPPAPAYDAGPEFTTDGNPVVPRDEVADNRVEPRSKMSRDLVAAIDSDAGGTYRVILQVDATVGEDPAAVRERVQALASDLNGTVIREIPLIGAVLLELDSESLLALADDSAVARMSLDAKVSGAMHVARESVGADQLATLSGTGYDGRGVVVAVLDSGVKFDHKDIEKFTPALKNSEKDAYRDFTTKLKDSVKSRWSGNMEHKDRTVCLDFTDPSEKGKDKYGHGSHVAGLLGGSGYSYYDKAGSHAYSGIAPSCTLLSMRVLDDLGSGYSSDVIDAIGFAVFNQDVLDIRVMNVSLGHPVFESYMTDPLALACAAAVEAGIAVVTSAGNHGQAEFGAAYGTITSPGHAPWVITVGATNTHGTVARSDDTIASFSSCGPTPIDGMIKPDLVAPGCGIVSVGAKDSYIDSNYDLMISAGYGLNTHYMKMSGTSMSAPIVSGTLACMFQANPSLTPSAAKAILMYTAQKMTEPNILAQGAGSLNAEGAVRLAAAIQQNSDTVAEGSFWLDALSPAAAIGMLDPYTNIGGEVAYWGSAIIWGDGFLWGGGITAGNTNIWGDGFLWDDVLNWPNGHLWYDSLLGLKHDVFGECFLWYTGCSGSVGGDGFTWGGGIGTVTGNSFLWSGSPGLGGLYDIWSTSFVDPASLTECEDGEPVFASGEQAGPGDYDIGEPGDWFFPVAPAGF